MLRYMGLESHSRTLTPLMTERYPLIFGFLNPSKGAVMIYESLKLPSDRISADEKLSFLTDLKAELKDDFGDSKSDTGMILRPGRTLKTPSKRANSADLDLYEPPKKKIKTSSRIVAKPKTPSKPPKTKTPAKKVKKPVNDDDEFEDWRLFAVLEEQEKKEREKQLIDLTTRSDNDAIVPMMTDSDVDLELALKLQSEFDKEGPAREQFECPICFDEKPVDFKFIYSNCPHSQCRDCVQEYFTGLIGKKIHPIVCVICKQQVSDFDLGLVLDETKMEEYWGLAPK